MLELRIDCTSASQLAIDFKIILGSEIAAARSGVGIVDAACLACTWEVNSDGRKVGLKNTSGIVQRVRPNGWSWPVGSSKCRTGNDDTILFDGCSRSKSARPSICYRVWYTCPLTPHPTTGVELRILFLSNHAWYAVPGTWRSYRLSSTLICLAYGLRVKPRRRGFGLRALQPWPQHSPHEKLSQVEARGVA